MRTIRNSAFPSGRLAFWLLLILAVLVLLRAVLPYTVEWYVNKRLDEAPAYDGGIGNVDLHLYRGAYSIEDVVIRKIEGSVPVPLFEAERVEFSVLWSALLDGMLVSSVSFDQPFLNIVDSENEADQQTGEQAKWDQVLSDLAPLRIEQITARNGEIHFRNFEVPENVDVFIAELDLLAENITNRFDSAEDTMASVQGRGRIMDQGELQFELHFSQDAEYPDFDLDGQMTDIPVLSLQELIKAYTPFDIEGGNMDLFVELDAAEGMVSGYAKPLITGLDIFDWRGDVIEDGDNPLQILWELALGFTSELLENQEHDRFATVVPIEGNFDNPETDNWTTFVNILHNAFVAALQPRFEGNEPEGEAADNPEVAAAAAEKTEE